MRARRATLFVLGGFVLVALGVCLVCLPSREPVCNGKRLSEWLSQYRSGSRDAWKETEVALRALEPGAMHLMANWIEYETPPWRRPLLRIANRLPMSRNRMHNRMNKDGDPLVDRAWDATFAFLVFDRSKTNLGPAFVRIANDRSRADSAVRAAFLLHLDPDFSVPTDFRSQIKNPEAEKQAKGCERWLTTW